MRIARDERLVRAFAGILSNTNFCSDNDRNKIFGLGRELLGAIKAYLSMDQRTVLRVENPTGKCGR